MEELVQERDRRQGFLARLFGRPVLDEIEEEDYEERRPTLKHPQMVASARYHITVRRQVVTFEDAVAAANGLKRGEQQILNLCSAEPKLREKIKDFLAGVNFAQEGTWEELGEHVYLLAPANAIVDTAPATPRVAAAHN